MSFNPAGTKWSVAPMNNSGAIDTFHPTPWEFNNESMNAEGIWIGGYRPIPNADGAYSCEILTISSANPNDRIASSPPDRGALQAWSADRRDRALGSTLAAACRSSAAARAISRD